MPVPSVVVTSRSQGTGWDVWEDHRLSILTSLRPVGPVGPIGRSNRRRKGRSHFARCESFSQESVSTPGSTEPGTDVTVVKGSVRVTTTPVGRSRSPRVTVGVVEPKVEYSCRTRSLAGGEDGIT